MGVRVDAGLALTAAWPANHRLSDGVIFLGPGGSMTGVLAAAWFAVAAQWPSSSRFDDGAIAGRVCVDADGDGRCGDDEAGVPGAIVRDETGLSVIADTEGRFHLAAVEGRALQLSHGGSVAPVVHRLAVELASLPPGAAAALPARSVEVPPGGVAWVDFAVRVATGRALIGVGPELPLTRARADQAAWVLALPAEPGAHLYVEGRDVAAADGHVSLALALDAGSHRVPFAVTSPTGRLELGLQRIDVARAPPGWVVVPRSLDTVGTILVGAGALPQARFTLAPGFSGNLGGVPLTFDEQGRATVPLVHALAEVVLRSPEGVTWTFPLSRPTRDGVTGQGVVSLEVGVAPTSGAWTLGGRGAASVVGVAGPVRASLDLDLRDHDLETLRSGGPLAVLSPRRSDVFERAQEPGVQPLTFGDGSTTQATNAAGGPLRAEVAWEHVGRVGFGGWRAVRGDGELGRFARAAQAGYLEAATPTEATVGASVTAWGAPALTDLRTGLSRTPAHDRFSATGGSVFYLRRFPIAEGSEAVRVEIRDATTGVPLGERHLVRGQDYVVDAQVGRLVLAAPLSFLVSPSLAMGDPLSGGATQVLVVDSEVLERGTAATSAWGARLGGRAGPVEASGDVLRDGDYALQAGLLTARLGPAVFSAEVAHSAGLSLGNARSDDGGWSWRQVGLLASSGNAATLRARSTGLGGQGLIDLSFRFREPGFQDAAGAGGVPMQAGSDPGLVDVHGARALRQYSLRAEQPVGRVTFGLLADQREGAEAPLVGDAWQAAARLATAWAGYSGDTWSARVELRGASWEIAALDGPWTRRESWSAGLSGAWRVAPWLQLRAGHRQRLSQTLVELAARPTEVALPSMDPTFTQAGVDLGTAPGPVLGLRAGWGPVIGPQAWGQVSWARGQDTWYGLHALDVDSPWGGPRRMATGVRREVGPGTTVFVEDVSAHDANVWRGARAVGASQRLSEGLAVTARYEHALEWTPDAVGAGGDAASARLAWEHGAARLFLQAEGRVASTTQSWLGAAGGDLQLSPSLTLAGRALASRQERLGVMEGRLVDANLSVAWRWARGLVVARYAYLLERRPGATLERNLQVLSVLPTLALGARFGLASGFHLARGSAGPVLAASVRPEVRVVGGLELGLEGAWRSGQVDAVAGAVTSSAFALRPEVGYRFDQRFRLAGGYALFGFCGTGVAEGACGSNDKAYLRGEAAW